MHEFLVASQQQNFSLGHCTLSNETLGVWLKSNDSKEVSPQDIVPKCVHIYIYIYVYRYINNKWNIMYVYDKTWYIFIFWYICFSRTFHFRYCIVIYIYIYIYIYVYIAMQIEEAMYLNRGIDIDTFLMFPFWHLRMPGKSLRAFRYTWRYPLIIKICGNSLQPICIIFGIVN